MELDKLSDLQLAALLVQEQDKAHQAGLRAKLLKEELQKRLKNTEEKTD